MFLYSLEWKHFLLPQVLAVQLEVGVETHVSLPGKRPFFWSNFKLVFEYVDKF
jgi:hypothetical protein